MSSLHSVVYVSTAVKPFFPKELAALLASSRKRNEQVGITGMLLYKDGCFIQAFEGYKGEVKRLHERIERDPRHRNFVVVASAPIERREFSDWTMGFKELDDEDVQSQPGFSEMLMALQHHGRFSIDPALARRLLLSFSEQPV